MLARFLNIVLFRVRYITPVTSILAYVSESAHWFLFYFFCVVYLPVDFIISIFDCVSWLTLLFKRCLQLSRFCSFRSRGYWHLYNKKESRLQKSGYSITEANISFIPGYKAIKQFTGEHQDRAMSTNYIFSLFFDIIQSQKELLFLWQ